jgi:hypothetical protein
MSSKPEARPDETVSTAGKNKKEEKVAVKIKQEVRDFIYESNKSPDDFE